MRGRFEFNITESCIDDKLMLSISNCKNSTLYITHTTYLYSRLSAILLCNNNGFPHPSHPRHYAHFLYSTPDLVQRPVVTNSPDEIVEEDLFNPTVLEYIVENFSWFIAFTIESPNGTEPDVTIKPLFSSNWDKISVRLRAQALGHYRLCMAYKINVTTDDHTTFNCSKTTDFKEGLLVTLGST